MCYYLPKFNFFNVKYLCTLYSPMFNMHIIGYLSFLYKFTFYFI